MHRKVAAALVAALALGVASCGGAESTAPLTSTSLAKKLETACLEGQQKTQAQMRATRATMGGSPAATAKFITAALAGQRVIVARIGELDAPAAKQADFGLFKHEMQQRLKLIASIDAAGSAGVQSALKATNTENTTITHRLRDVNARLGVRGCG